MTLVTIVPPSGYAEELKAAGDAAAAATAAAASPALPARRVRAPAAGAAAAAAGRRQVRQRQEVTEPSTAGGASQPTPAIPCCSSSGSAIRAPATWAIATISASWPWRRLPSATASRRGAGAFRASRPKARSAARKRAAAARHLHERVRPRASARRAISTRSTLERHRRRFTTSSSLPPAKVRVKIGGGIAGHNGLRSITAHVGNDYKRVRIGIGHPGDEGAGACAHVLGDFAKAERGLGRDADAIPSPTMPACSRAGRIRQFPEQGPSRDGSEGLSIPTASNRANPERQRERYHGLQMRHRRPAECRQVDALQRADPNRGGAGGELSVLHHRAECRRGRGAGSAAATSCASSASRRRSFRRG